LSKYTIGWYTELGDCFQLGVALAPEEIIARKLYGTYGAGALGQAKTCASLARVMADWPSTGIWNRVIAILTEGTAPLVNRR
jgi:hypothetical protein